MRAARITAHAVMAGSLAGLIGCAPGEPAPEAEATPPDYLGAEARLLKDDLVQVTVSLKGGRAEADLHAYARCVAAGYAVKNKAGFVRHVRTVSDKEGGIWRADAVYSVTSALPEGLQTIDAEVAAEDCVAEGIPTG